MWSKFCVALVTRYDLLSQQKFETIELFIFILDIFALIHLSIMLLIYVATTSKIGLSHGL